jgi:hypothetical protein
MGFTDATSEKQLLGPFKTTTIAGGLGLAGAASQYSTSGKIWVSLIGWSPSIIGSPVQATLTQGYSTTSPFIGSWQKPK